MAERYPSQNLGRRGPVFLYDNQFTNGPAGGPGGGGREPGGPSGSAPVPIQPNPPASSNHTFWVFANNRLDGKPASAAALITAPSNVQIYDLGALAPGNSPDVPPSLISAGSVFLKPSWPLPSKIFDVTHFGANGSHAGDDTVGIQAAIDAAAKAGGGAMAYLPAGQYTINQTLRVTGANFWLGGAGYASTITFSCPPVAGAKVKSCPASGAALHISAASGVTIEQLQITTPSGTDQLLVQGGTGVKLLKLDGIYCGVDVWNSTNAIHIDGLQHGEVVHAVHLDGNMNVSNSDAGTVLVGMLIQSALHVNGPEANAGAEAEAGAGAETRTAVRGPAAAPALGFLTFIGLVDDYDVIVEDDKSVVIEDLYCEQLKVGHLRLSGSGSGSVPGRVVIHGIKSGSFGPDFATIDNYFGSLFYMSSMFLEKSYPQWEITQTGSAEFNLTLMANNFDSSNIDYLGITLGAGGKKGSVNLIANSASNFSDTGCGEVGTPAAAVAAPRRAF